MAKSALVEKTPTVPCQWWEIVPDYITFNSDQTRTAYFGVKGTNNNFQLDYILGVFPWTYSVVNTKGDVLVEGIVYLDKLFHLLEKHKVEYTRRLGRLTARK